MTLRIVSGGITYERAKSILVSRDIRNYTGQFRATLAVDQRSVIGLGADIRILNSVGGTIFNGYVDRLEVTQEPGIHEVRLSGRDKTSDLVDSALVEKQFVGPMEFEALCRLVISKQKAPIEVLNLATDLRQIEKTELVSGEIGQKAMDFLDSYAARVQALLTTNDDGRLLILRSDQAASSGLSLVRQADNPLTNVLRSSASLRNDRLFGSYAARSQVAPAGEEVALTAPELVTQVGRASDPSARPSRFMEFVAETPMDAQALRDRAELERNVRRADSLSYRARIQGDAPELAINTTTRVLDDLCGIDDELIVSSITRSFATGGTVTDIDCTFQDSYSLK